MMTFKILILSLDLYCFKVNFIVHANFIVFSSVIFLTYYNLLFLRKIFISWYICRLFVNLLYLPVSAISVPIRILCFLES